MPNHPSPTPTPLPSPHRNTRAIVRRARLEHLASELLRLGDAMRPPVPVENLYAHPPHDLWQPDPAVLAHATETTTPDIYHNRLDLARAVAQQISGSAWPLRLQLLGPHPLTEGEIEMFALALLLPTGLLAGVSEQQRTPQTIAIIFQTPINQAVTRLGELGYLAPGENDSLTQETTD
ncbi:MAG: hypothetical protein HY866_05240 [Chloroflexi bacterium]|nr:hypothetical protein [Chloroflexota bacterium]